MSSTDALSLTAILPATPAALPRAELRHQVVDDLGSWLLFKRVDEDLYAVGSISVDRFLVVPASKLQATMRIIQYLDGSHELSWIQQQISLEFGRNVKLEDLFPKLKNAGLIKTAQIPLAAQSEMLRHSLRLFSIDVEGFFARLCVLHRLFSPYLLAAGFIFIAAVFGFVRLPHSQPAIAAVHITYSMYFCIWAGVLLLALIHEMFHGFAGMRYGLKPKKITAALYLGFIPYAFISIPGVYTIAPRRRIVLWSAGIYANMLLAAFFLLVQSVSDNPFAAQVLKSLIWVNFSLVLFNLVPFMGTDSYFILSTIFKVPNIRTNAYTEFKHWIRREEHKFSGFLIVYFIFSFGLVLYFIYRLLFRLYLTATAVSREGLHFVLLYHAWPFAMIILMFIARRLWDHRDRKRNPEEHGGTFTKPRTA